MIGSKRLRRSTIEEQVSYSENCYYCPEFMCPQHVDEGAEVLADYDLVNTS